MTHRYTLAALMLAAMSIPAAAQQTTQPDTSKKADVSAPQPDTSKKAGVSGTTTTVSPGAIAEPAKASESPSGVTASPGASVTAPAPSSTMTPSPAAPSPGASVTAPSPSSSGASVTAPAPSNADASVKAPAAGGETGKVQPTSGAVKVDVKVAPTLANTVKISADSAFALAKASPDAGEISSAELEMKEKALVYNIKMLKGAGASVVHVDAMTGEVVKDKKFGGLKASAENDKQLKKLDEAKKDSSATAKP
jgi:uncharacterized membrane protein YkoI